ncbi:MAG: tRNA 2-thiocytidine biosynthesis protein TtcA [Candidatus Izimaplasma sp.]|nr:tRNA 2-thiocytidine biosynthesis protein TtcA [Candidatus Izimaplasma bacterium]
MKPHTKFERSIMSTYRKSLWNRLIQGIKKYNLIQNGDKIAVTISGGKDSLIMAKLFQELKRHPEISFELVFITMDPGFNQVNLDLIADNTKKLDIPVEIRPSNTFDILSKHAKGKPCYLCASMRRGFLYNFAKELGCNKLALGHHFDDVIETTLMNMFYAGSFKTMLPKVKSKNYEGIELIRPMYLIREKDIKRIMKTNNIETMGCGCQLATCDITSKRATTKQLIKTLKEQFDDIDKNIFRAAENVNLDSIVRWKQDGKVHTYYDDFESK